MTPEEECADGLRRLDALEAEGKGDSPEYDAVCDAMDRPWSQLDAAAQARVRKLSADLNAARAAAQPKKE